MKPKIIYELLRRRNKRPAINNVQDEKVVEPPIVESNLISSDVLTSIPPTQLKDENKIDYSSSGNILHSVNDVIKEDERKILSISSICPFTKIKNTLHINEGSLTFVYNHFLVDRFHTVYFKDILEVILQKGPIPFLSSIAVRLKDKGDIVREIGNFKNKEALRAHKIINKLKFYSDKNIDTSKMELNVLINMHLIKIK